MAKFDILNRSLEQPTILKWVCLNEGVQLRRGGGCLQWHESDSFQFSRQHKRPLSHSEFTVFMNGG